MTTPNITSGVLERVKPMRLKAQTVFRFESTLGQSASITSPIFDCVGDGWPFTQVEVGTASVVRVASREFCMFAMITSTVGMKLDIFEVGDTGVIQNPQTIYLPSDGNNSPFAFRWRCPGRRCQFRLTNQPLGTAAGTNSAAFLEIVNEG